MRLLGLVALLFAACARQDVASTRTVDLGGTLEAASVCTSGKYWSGDEGSSKMHPGRACIACHESGGSQLGGGDDDDHHEDGEGGDDDAPALLVAGTVYPSAHEPDDCYGITGAVVDITDANGVDYKLKVNASGNFLLKQKDAPAFATPFFATVMQDGHINTMKSSQTSGDCNVCHSRAGTSMAPGRVLAP